MKRRAGRERPQDAVGVEANTGLMEFLLTLDRRLSAVEQACDLLRHAPVEKDWYSTTELAEALGLTQYTIQERYCNGGRITCEKDPDNGKWRIPAAEYHRLVRGGGLKPPRN